MVSCVNAGLRELLPDVVLIQGGSVPCHVSNLVRLNPGLGLVTTWKAIAAPGPDGTEVVPPYLPLAAMDPIISSAAAASRASNQLVTA
jgi:hypothetical protein